MIFRLISFWELIVKNRLLLDGIRYNLSLVMVEESAGRVRRTLGMQMNDMHKRSNHKPVTQCQRKTISHRQIIQCQRTIPIRVLVATYRD